jgi:TPR repeat protein
MNNVFKNYLLATSCLVVSLAYSFPSMAMVNGKEEDTGQQTSSAVTAKGPKEQPSEDLSTAGDAIPVQDKFDIKEWDRSFITTKGKSSLVTKLTEHARAGNPEAQDKLYFLSNTTYVTPQCGAEILSLAWGQKQGWARKRVKEMRQDPNDAVKERAYIFLYNHSDPDLLGAAEAWLNKRYQYSPAEAEGVATKITLSTTVPQREAHIASFKAKWGSCPYTKPFIDLYKALLGTDDAIMEIKKELLEIAARKGDLDAMNGLGNLLKATNGNKEDIIKNYAQAANGSCVEAMYNLGAFFHHTDPMEAETWYRKVEKYPKAAVYPQAMNNLGILLQTIEESLPLAWKQKQEWARKRVEKMRQDPDDVVKERAYIFLYNHNDPDLLGAAEAWLNNRYQYDPAEAEGVATKITLSTTVPQREAHIASFKAKWGSCPYTKPFIALYKALHGTDAPTMAIKKELLEIAARKGDLDAMNGLGNLLKATNGNKEDIIKNYTQAANGGCVEAMYNLGVFFYHTDPMEAETWYRKVEKYPDNKLYPQAMNNLGTLWKARKPEEAISYFTTAATQGFKGAWFNLGNLYASGYGDQAPNIPQAIHCYTQGANQGDMDALFNLGRIHAKGYGDQAPDIPQAIDCYTRAANSGYVLAMNNLAILIKLKNPAQAAELYRQAAKRGHVSAMYNEGLFYEKGCGNQLPDIPQAIQSYEAAAAKNCVPAFTRLGFCYLALNQPQKAHTYFETAKALRDANAAIFLQQAALPAEAETPSTVEQDVALTQALEASLKPEVVTTPLSEPLGDTALSQGGQGEDALPTSSASFSSSASLSAAPALSTTQAPKEVLEEVSASEGRASALPQALQKGKAVNVPQDITNPKYIREQLRKGRDAADEAKRRQSSAEERRPDLDKGSLRAADYLRQKEVKHITDELIRTLFSDAYFKGQVEVKSTSNGVMVIATTDTVLIASDHRVHRAQADGYHENFIKALNKILDLFDVPKV